MRPVLATAGQRWSRWCQNMQDPVSQAHFRDEDDVVIFGFAPNRADPRGQCLLRENASRGLSLVAGLDGVGIGSDAFVTAHGVLPLPLDPQISQAIFQGRSAAQRAAQAAEDAARAARRASKAAAKSNSNTVSASALLDSEGYVQSFAANEVVKFRAFFEDYGFVVIRDVLSADDCQATVDEIWSLIENGQPCKGRKGKKGGRVQRNDPATWDDASWSGAVGPLSLREGMVGTGAIFAPRAIYNRYNPAMLCVTQQLLGDADLIVSHDRYGIFRPTSLEGHEDHTTVGNLHLDMNPWRFLALKDAKHQIQTADGKSSAAAAASGMTPPMTSGVRARSARAAAEVARSQLAEPGLARLQNLQYADAGDFLEENNLPLRADRPAVQMLINLADNREEDGGLTVVPRFPRLDFEAWTKSHRRSMLNESGDSKNKAPYTLDDNFIRLDDDDPVRQKALRVASRAGSLIVWDKRMVHGSLPNQSDRFRYAQFFLMAPRSAVALDAARAHRRRKAVLKGLACARIDPETLPAYAQRLFDLSHQTPAKMLCPSE